MSLERPKQDAKGNPLRYAKTGHVTNYEETKVGAYTLPDPLFLRGGERVGDAQTWWTRRRPTRTQVARGRAETSKANLVMYLPQDASAERPVPVLLHLVFFGGLPTATPPATPLVHGNGTGGGHHWARVHSSRG